ncbi:MAG: methyltransferase domain-containing protein [Thermodesulfobacteriota bacterium]|nr:methyltransferase domain-containing protein [Thermodesulfobacteriota bacterium]
MSIGDVLLGNRIDRMPNVAFHLMSLMFKLMKVFFSYEKAIDRMGIQEGMTVVDYGCGPGNYILGVAKRLGRHGKLYAVDVHELAVKAVDKIIKKENLINVETALVQDYRCEIPNHVADLIYAMDMFHMVKHPNRFLVELHRILKSDGRLIIEDGHQPREKTKDKINQTRIWKIVEQEKRYLVCRPV